MILITGATGFVGTSLTQHLRARELPYRPYTGRLNDTVQLREQLAGVQTVIHLATAQARGSRRLLEQVDVFGAEQLVKTARYHEIEHLIILSHINADPNSVYPVLQTKGRVERLVTRSGVPYTILRSAFLFGRYDRFTNLIASLALWNWPLVWLPAGGRSVVQPLWVEDLVRCIGLILDNPAFTNQTVTIAGNERYRYADLVFLIMEAIHIRRRPLNIHPQIVKLINRALFAPWPYPPVTQFYLDQLAVSEIAPLDSVPDRFGFHPARLAQHLSHLRRPGLRRHLFNKKF